VAGEELRMPVDAVRRHAGSAYAAADAVDAGREAAAYAQLGSHAYGEICTVLPALINPLADRAVMALRESVSALRETATNLRAAATAAEAADASSADRTGRAGGFLEPPS
jgi:hypothetical protein